MGKILTKTKWTPTESGMRLETVKRPLWEIIPLLVWRLLVAMWNWL
jgi:hypothetical protein